MKRLVSLLTVAFMLIFTLNAMAQERTSPLIVRGSQELGVSGNIDFEGPSGDVDVDLNLSYGYFIRDFLEVGGLGNFSRELDGDVMRYGVGAFGEYHFAGFAGWQSVVPYLGASLILSFLDTDIGDDESALIFTPRLGLKWFIRNYFAIDTNLFVALATDDVFVNDEDLDSYDVGMRLGLRVYFD